MQAIYLDSSSTTSMLPPVWEAMQPYFSERFGNPSSSHQFGRHARRGLEGARQTLASLLDCRPEELFFTSGATEANNLAVFGLCGQEAGSILASALEHPCVSAPLEQLALRGLRTLPLPVTSHGIAAVPDSLPSDLRLACLMLVNHEIGTIQPVRELVAQLNGLAPVHCDAAAAAGKISISFRALGVTSLTLSAHKFHGPKGIGVLVLKRGTRLLPLTWGGHQQAGKRPGTEPVALIVGMAKALELAQRDREETVRHVHRLRERFLEQLHAAAPVLNGDPNRSVPHVLNLSFPGCRADALLMKLDLAGIACSTGSACSSGSLLASPVIQALGVEPEVLQSAMRFSFDRLLRIEEVEEAARRIVYAVKGMRAQGNDEQE